MASPGATAIRLERSWFLFPLALGFAPFLTSVHVGQINVITEFGIFLAFVAETAFPVVAGTGLALAICTKVTPVAFLGYYLVNKRFKAMAATLAAVAVLCAIAAARYGWSPFFTYARIFPTLTRVFMPGSASMALVAGLASRSSAVHSVQTALTIYVAAVVLLTGLCCFITKEREPLFIVVCLAAMLSPNLVWDHHFVFLLLPLMVWMAWSNFQPAGRVVVLRGTRLGPGGRSLDGLRLYVHAFGHASMLLLLLWQVYEVCGCGRFAWGKTVRNTLAGLIASGLLLGAAFSGWGRPGLAAMEKGDAAVHSGHPDLAVAEYTEAIRLIRTTPQRTTTGPLPTRRRANTTRPLPTARRRSRSTVKTRGRISTGALPSCQRVIWIRRLPIIPRPFGSIATSPDAYHSPFCVAYEARGARGIAYVIRGEPDKAIADFTEVIRFSPQDAATYGNRARLTPERAN